MVGRIGCGINLSLQAGFVGQEVLQLRLQDRKLPVICRCLREELRLRLLRGRRVLWQVRGLRGFCGWVWRGLWRRRRCGDLLLGSLQLGNLHTERRDLLLHT